MGWQFHWFPPDGRCVARVLDEATGDTPCILRSFDGHCMWANTAAMTAAGVYSVSCPDPPGGIIDRGEDGLPVGCFREKAGDIFRYPPSFVRMETSGSWNKCLCALGVAGVRVREWSVV